MICITVTPVSRRLAKADLLNAARHGDIVELCLDHFQKEPDVKDLISAIDKPMIVSCRRPQDGGAWQGTEEERLLLLRQAIVAGPAYIELDLDIAPNVPRFGKTKRVISFTRLDRPETDIDSVLEQASRAQADVVKFCWPTPNLDAAWPLLAAVSQKRTLPVVGMGLGRPELTFSLLGLKYGSPWIYAALEQGMQTHPGQATVFELTDTYDFRSIGPKTAFVGVAGFGRSQIATTRILNTAFRELDANIRCLPLQLGDVRSLKKMLDALKIRAVIVKGEHGRALFPLADQIPPNDAQSRYVDLLVRQDDGWLGFNSLWRSALKTLEEALGGDEHALQRHNVLVIGNGGIAQSMVHAIVRRKGPVSICGPDDNEAKQTAQTCECRFIPFQNLYETLTDLIIVADPELEVGTKHSQINPSLFRPTMTVMDVSDLPLETSLMTEARSRGCRIIPTSDLFAQMLNAQFKTIKGQELPPSALASGSNEA